MVKNGFLAHVIERTLQEKRKNGWGRVVRKCFGYIGKKIEEKRLEPFFADGHPERLYDSEYQDDIDFYGQTSEIKPVAFYLPQFHTFPENDAWWGHGFTEWTNTKKAVPRFDGHYQPRVPHRDIGYYKLDDAKVIRQQAILAKNHGIYGFAFYYYWFSGKRLMEKPIDLLLEHPEIDIHFCLCWANENWTRAWDGGESEILMEQDYTRQDAENFISDIRKYIMDARYIRVDNKPVILVYNADEIKNVKKVFQTWREYAVKEGVGEICIWICQTKSTAKVLGISRYIDAEVEFPPHNMRWKQMYINQIRLTEGKEAILCDYHKQVQGIVARMKKTRKSAKQKPLYYCCMLGWDNAARRMNGWTSYLYFSLEDFYRWVNEIVQQTRKNHAANTRFFFINAWNEWAEGTYLEPDEKFGYASINTFSKALYEMDFDGNTERKSNEAE